MYKIWPLNPIPTHLQRPEPEKIRSLGYSWNDPFDIVEIFERKVAEFAGAKYAVAVDCCSHGLFLCLKYLRASGKITIPAHTYISVPMQIQHAGCEVDFRNQAWDRCYQLSPYPIWDCAALWYAGMFKQEFSVISFQIKKPIPIGRGGIILTDNHQAAEWLRQARYDGRRNKTNQFDTPPDFRGWHYYMTPEDAARGILLYDALHRTTRYPNWEEYPDISVAGIL